MDEVLGGDKANVARQDDMVARFEIVNMRLDALERQIRWLIGTMLTFGLGIAGIQIAIVLKLFVG